MAKDVSFDTLTKEEATLLLKAFDYSLDAEGHILKPDGSKIPSKDIPARFLKIGDAAFVPGSFNVIDGSPDSISKFIREKIEK